MRTAVVLVMLAACGGAGSKSGSGGGRPAVIPKLSELPLERERRDAILDSSVTTAGPEHRRGMTVRERKVETRAATAAAVLGWLLSDNENVTLGSALSFDENAIVDQPTPPPRSATEPAADAAPPDTSTLVPWVRLKTPPPPPPDGDGAAAPDAR